MIEPPEDDAPHPADSANVIPITRARRASARAKKDPTRELTEIDIAERVIQRFGIDLRYCAALGGWHAWSGTHWAQDALESARECVKAVARDLATDAVADDDLWGAAKRCASSNGTSSILDVMRSDARVVFAPDQANADPWLLNCTNGTVDLRTGVLAEHDRKQLITRCAGAPYHAECAAPRFDGFLRDIQHEHEMRAYLSRLLGYAAIGVVQEHVLGVMWGTGKNGKSVLSEVAMAALGDYAKPGPTSLIVQNGHHEPHPTDIASCVGSRLVVVHETKRGARFDSSKVKLLTGGDRLTARHMRQDFFTFVPSHTLLMLSNYKPEADATDSALWRRVHLIPFPYVVPEEKRDKTLAATIIREELAGVLSWIVAGAVAWISTGLCPPKTVVDASASYRSAEDTLSQWIEDRCVILPSATCMGGTLMESYQRWCKAMGFDSVRGTDFAAELEGRGYVGSRSAKGKVYKGIGLAAEASNDEFGGE